MLSASSFTAELIAFRDSRKLPEKPGDPGPAGIGNRNSADTDLLNRWIARPDREELWKALQSSISAPALIRLVLTARRKAGATANQLYGRKWKARIRGNPRADDDHQSYREDIIVDGEVKGLRREWQEVWKKLRHPSNKPATREFLDRLDLLLLRYSAALDERPRKGDERNAARLRLFWINVSNRLIQSPGGKPFDREVAALSEIAFDLEKGSVDIKRVTEARRRWRAEQH